MSDVMSGTPNVDDARLSGRIQWNRLDELQRPGVVVVWGS